MEAPIWPLSVFLAIVFAFQALAFSTPLPILTAGADFQACGASLENKGLFQALFDLNPITLLIDAFNGELGQNSLLNCSLGLLKIPVHALGTIFNLLTFNVEGAPVFIRFIIGTPLTIAFAIVAAPLMVSVVRALGNLLPFT